MSTTSAALATPYPHEHWSSRLAFIFAATGSAVGLGNVWKFPYITGEYGGGAFVLVYLGCIALIGIPIMMAEVLIGRRGGQSPIHGMINLARAEGKSTGWQLAGWSGVLGSFIILSFYSVIAGWSLVYVWYAVSGVFDVAAADPAQAAEAIGGIFSALLADPVALLLWHTLFMMMTVLIVARGVKAGLEKAVTYLMPALFVLLVFLVVNAAVSTGKLTAALGFLFRPDFSKLTTEAVLVALGHAFFTLSLGAGIMVAYGSYLPRHISIARASITVSILDTVVALLAGLAIFPVVFAHAGLEPSAGPGLIFVTLPIAFGQMPLGTLFGTLFFVLLVFAALSSAISLLEPMVEYVQEHRGVRRVSAAVGAGVAVWLLGIVSVLSFNRWEEIKFFGKTLFDLLDFITANIMLPLTGLLLAVFAGWMMSKQSTLDELEMQDGPGYRLWRTIIRYVTPVGVLIVFVYNLL
jgi:NSS family neurotransmitter:Na+ symporter